MRALDESFEEPAAVDDIETLLTPPINTNQIHDTGGESFSKYSSYLIHILAQHGEEVPAVSHITEQQRIEQSDVDSSRQTRQDSGQAGQNSSLYIPYIAYIFS